MPDRNEAQTRLDLIDPALAAAGWGTVDRSRIQVEVIAPGRLLGAGTRATAEKADYVLIYKNQKLAVIEAKKESLQVTEGLGQAKRYAKKLDTRFAYATNGHGIYRVDTETGEEGDVDRYPTPDELWEATFGHAEAKEQYWRDRFSQVAFETKGGQWQTRYYQHNAITKTLDAMSKGQDRILLTLATGTGKTALAFQVAWKLFHSKWNITDAGKGLTGSDEPSRRPRILFLADRNILADQAFNSFSSFDDDALVRIDPASIRKKGRVPKNASIFFTIFQTFMTGKDKDGNPKPSFGEYPPDFFDFIVIDECHRGGANDESNWRDIMEHFSPAVQLGLTATPKRKHNADTYAYFGDPVYIYSLKEGINDGYLSPFKVKQFSTTIDKYIYTSDDLVIEGDPEEGRVYEEEDFQRVIEIKEREKIRVELFMNEIDQSEKTLVFCATQIHALAVRDLINQIKTSTDSDYCHRVTANDGKIGEQHLRTFQDNEKTIPTILTTSQKLSTGVDARNIRNIVLMRPINSMIEFKQIVGRGTRLFDGKDYFTIYDFVKAHEHFQDPEWDGEPLPPDACEKCGDIPCSCVKTPPKACSKCGEIPCVCLPEPCSECGELPCCCSAKKMIKVKLAEGKELEIQHMMQTSFWSPSGTPISQEEFLIQLFGDLPDLFKNEGELRALWSKPDTRRQLLEGLEEKGYGPEQLSTLAKMVDAQNSDLYDVLSYIAFTLPPMSREERVALHQDRIFKLYQDKQQEFLSFVLDQYIQEGVSVLDDKQLPTLIDIKYHNVTDATKELGNPEHIRELFVNFQKHLYEAVSVA